jgi:hypothetical protein
MTSTDKYLTLVTADQVKLEIKDPVDATALEQSQAILSELRNNVNGPVDPTQLMAVAKRLGDLPAEAETYIASKDDCRAAFEGLGDTERKALVNIHARVKVFAEAQRASVRDMEIDIPGGKAGHTVSPCRGTSWCIQSMLYN